MTAVSSPPVSSSDIRISASIRSSSTSSLSRIVPMVSLDPSSISEISAPKISSRLAAAAKSSSKRICVFSSILPIMSVLTHLESSDMVSPGVSRMEDSAISLRVSVRAASLQPHNTSAAAVSPAANRNILFFLCKICSILPA